MVRRAKNKIKTSMSLDKNVYEILKILSSKTGIAQSKIVEKALKIYFFRHKDAIKSKDYDGWFEEIVAEGLE